MTPADRAAADVAALIAAGRCAEAERLGADTAAAHPDAAIALRAWRFALLAARGRRVDPGLIPQDVRSLAAETYAVGYTLHAVGRVREGWRYMEGRRRGDIGIGISPLHDQLVASGVPPWFGEPVAAGATICVSHEQGLGDTLQFVRYLPRLQAAGFHAQLFVPRTLMGFLRAQPLLRDVRLLLPDTPMPRPDWCLPLLSLPHLLGDTAAPVPSPDGYLVATAVPPPLPPHPGPRIGVAWRGARNGAVERDVPIDLVTNALCGRGAQIVSLKPDIDDAERDCLNRADVVVLPELDPPDFAFIGTAALIAGLDLVIAADTSVAHLAGALGRPVWLLLKEEPDWRWQFERTDTDWYRSMRLFRQPQAGDWASVLAAASAALDEFLAARGLIDAPA